MKEETKSIECNLVKIGKLSDKGNCASKTDAKLRIECSIWSFPCPSYSYKAIKEHLEEAIREVLNIKEVEVKDFNTNIIQYP